MVYNVTEPFNGKQAVIKPIDIYHKNLINNLRRTKQLLAIGHNSWGGYYLVMEYMGVPRIETGMEEGSSELDEIQEEARTRYYRKYEVKIIKYVCSYVVVI